MFNDDIFLSFALIIGLATLLGAIGQRIRIPLIIMFLATGILAGPGGLDLISNQADFEILAQIGVALLLFIVGLKLDINLIKNIGPVALATGLGQIVFTSLIGFILTLVMGMDIVNAAYISVALTFSSTIIVVKLLSDKKEIESLHGQIALGFLIVQDIVAIIALVTLTTIGADLSSGVQPVVEYLWIIGKGVGFLIVIGAIGRFVIPWVTARLAGSQEMLALFGIAWAVLLGACSELLGFTKEVGAFVAGVTLASTDYRNAIGARLTGVRDFLLLFFFIGLGMNLDWSEVGSKIGFSIIMSLFVLIGNPLIVLIIMGFMGYKRRTGFLAGLTVAQISEFSLVVATLGVGLGHISEQTLAIITLVGIITIFVSTYMILYSEQLYRLLSKPLKVFERKRPFREMAIGSLEGSQEADIILVGLGNYGSEVAERLLKKNKRIMAVDHDPEVLKRWKQRGVPVLYGDMIDDEIYENLPLHRVEWIVSTIRDRDLNLGLLQHIKRSKLKVKVALTAQNEKEAGTYEKKGARLVFNPFKDASEQAADSLTNIDSALPESFRCSFSLREIPIGSWPGKSGMKVSDLPLRSIAGVSILSVKRGGRSIDDPPSDFRIFAGDRIVLVGIPDRIDLSERVLEEIDDGIYVEDPQRYIMANISVKDNPEISDRSLNSIHFKQMFGATVLGIRKNDGPIESPDPDYKLSKEDRLIVIGPSDAVNRFKLSDHVCP
ncbi:MAG: cation:proton antiporter [Candidatus Thermoplasmatota archaeon]|nr:cation:proton antiporter [Candidatus Thermoplasmatota archaeon]